MISIQEQVARGVLVCPETKKQLYFKNGSLTTEENKTYKVIKGTPILIDEKDQQLYLSENESSMKCEYEKFETSTGIINGINKFFNSYSDYASQTSRKAFQTAIGDQKPGSLCLSVGGGPRRAHPSLVNLNIGLFENVDVVADAYSIPYTDKSIDAIYCGAVLEHLEFPEKAVKEMHRVLKDQGLIYSDTPFIQAFHGYPNHFQNFTLIGHERLYSRNGFSVLESGVCVGPTYAFADIHLKYLKTLLGNSIFYKVISKLFQFSILPIRRFDKFLNKKDDAYIIASTTFVLARKTN